MYNNKRILVVGWQQQTQTAHQIQYLRQQGAEIVVLEPYTAQKPYPHLNWQAEQVSWQGIDISPSQIAAVLVSAQTPDIPVEAAFKTQADERLDWPQWFQQYGLQRDRSDTLLSLLLMYEALEIPMFNPVGRSLISRRKPYQLRLLQTVGCAIPPTLISNDDASVQQFIEHYGDCIMKPAAGGSLTLSANELLASGTLNKLEAAPAILQQRIYGEDLRVMLVDGVVVSCASVGVPEGLLDFRADNTYQRGGIHYRNVELPLEIQLQCSKAAHALGLRFAGIDLKLTAEGEFYMLECNSSPIYLDVEHKLQHPITQRLGNAILSAAQRANPLAAYAPF